MTNSTFTYVAKNNIQFEIYNTTENMIHAIQLNKKGEKCSPNSKTLLAMDIKTFNYGLQTGGIKSN